MTDSPPRRGGFFGRLPDPLLAIAALVAAAVLGLMSMRTFSGFFEIVKDPGVGVGASRDEVQAALGEETDEPYSREELQAWLAAWRASNPMEVVAGDCALLPREPEGRTLEGIPEDAPPIARHHHVGRNEFLVVYDADDRVKCLIWVDQN